VLPLACEPSQAMSDHDDKKKNRSEDLLTPREEVQQLFKRGAEFTEELLKQNERLRYRIAQLESQGGSQGSDDSLLKELVEKIQRLETERDDIRRRFSEVEAENRDFASRYVEIEDENNKLMNIYVASYQLHSTLDFDEVLQILTEIILNFVGAENFAIALKDDTKHELHPLIVEGVEPADIRKLPMNKGVVGDVLKKGDAYFAPSFDDGAAPDKPVVCVPLRIKDNVIGVVIIYRFLEQKRTLANVDHEIFTLLAGHAATAIFSAKLYTDSQRKLSTIQGLIDLVTS
jgi:hypothetical protein